MYSFQTNAGKRKNKQTIRLLCILIFVLLIALCGVSYSYLKMQKVINNTTDSFITRATSEAADAQLATYRLTQSSGTSTTTLLSTIRSHIYAIQCLNLLASNVYGPGTVLVDGALLTACTQTIDQCETRLQAGAVTTALYTDLRDRVDELVAAFALPDIPQT